MIDVSHQVSSVERRVGHRTLAAGEAHTATISRVYDTSVEDLWDACTDPERLPRWFLPVSGDLRVGGRYAIEGNASGTIERCEPPHELAVTWEIGGATSWVELRITAEGEDRARFTLDHVSHVDDAIWAQYGPGAVGVGWELAVMGLTLYHSGGRAPVDAAAVMAWQASDEGREMIRRASDGWLDADLAAGTDPETARAAAARTAGAYTGEPDAGAAAER
jgi:uncharacterized protein YndB with AHSA1/START domain